MNNREFDNTKTDFDDEEVDHQETPFDVNRRMPTNTHGTITSSVSIMNITAMSGVNETVIMDERKQPANINKLGKLSPATIPENKSDKSSANQSKSKSNHAIEMVMRQKSMQNSNSNPSNLGGSKSGKSKGKERSMEDIMTQNDDEMMKSHQTS